MTDLRGHVALITGGNGGIGLGMAMGLARAGADVAIWGTNPAKNEAAAARIAQVGTQVHTEVCDVADEAAQLASFDRTVDVLGKVDSVFANAGVTGGVPSFVDLTLEEWRRVMAVNLDGAFVSLRLGARHLVERGEGGSLVAVSSTSAIHGAQFNPHYGASKTALLGLVRAVAVNLARHRIRVNALLPGWTDTDLMAPGRGNQKFIDATIGRTPVRRWADPAEFGPVAVYLADPAITFHTGDAVVVDGGYTIF
jgi:NAD(P)-dependent dehydrogenase (short-subunit alcohol dehydrogenase family)